MLGLGMGYIRMRLGEGGVMTVEAKRWMGWVVVLGAGCSSPLPTIEMDTTPRVATVSAASAPTAAFRTVQSRVDAAKDARLSVRRPGTVVSVPVDVGDRVEKGEALVRLDPREARARLRVAKAAVEEAEAMLQDAQSTMGRLEQLGDGVSEAEQDRAEVAQTRADAALQRAKAQEDLALLELEYMTLTAPFDGVVVAQMAMVGEGVAGGAPLVRMVDTSSLEVTIGVLEDELRGLQSGGGEFTIRGGGVEVTAELTTLAVASDPRSGTWSATLNLPENSFAAGVPVTVTLSIPQQQDATLVPSAALDGGRVWVVEDGRVRPVAVDVQWEGPEGLAVTGVNPGEEVVIYGQGGRKEGEQVVVLQGVPQ